SIIDAPRLANTARFFEDRKKWHLAQRLYAKGVDSAQAVETAPLMNMGAYYARRGDRGMALTIMQDALARKAKDPAILAGIARVHLVGGDKQAAEAAIDAALEANPEHPDANQLKGEILFARNAYAKAIRQFDLTISRDPENYRAYYYKALCLKAGGSDIQPEVDLYRAAAGFHDDAEKWVQHLIEENLSKTLELKPDMLRAKLMLADVYLRNGLKYDAREQIDSALAQSPGRMETLTLLGSLKLMDGDLAGAEALCKKVLATHPDLGSWHSRLGIVYMRKGRREEAIAAFRTALDLNPERFTPLKLLTDAHLQEKEFNAAIKVAALHKKRIKNNRFGVANIDNLQGTIYMAWKKQAQARRHFEAAIAGAPNFMAPRLGLAAVHLRENDIDGAISIYKDILTINKSNLTAWTTYMALADIHYRRGDKKQAQVYYRNALDIRPDFGPAANNLAYLLSSRDDKLQEALDLARLANMKMPNDSTVKDTLGWIYYRTGQYVNAAAELDLSLKINPDSATTNYHMGLVYYRQGRFADARSFFSKALQIDANFEGAEEARSFLD
ncbi:tetratricopeptide repeat protein, partial [Desulfosarcina sp.]|nr:tetratricopeptide repeat protein [Desulfosarcina sp.]